MKIVFTEHAKERIKRRGISEEEVINAIKYQDKTKKKHGKYYVIKDIGKGEIEVVYEKENYIKVITVYWIK